jgi:hypothetical protein
MHFLVGYSRVIAMSRGSRFSGVMLPNCRMNPTKRIRGTSPINGFLSCCEPSIPIRADKLTNDRPFVGLSGLLWEESWDHLCVRKTNRTLSRASLPRDKNSIAYGGACGAKLRSALRWPAQQSSKCCVWDSCDKCFLTIGHPMIRTLHGAPPKSNDHAKLSNE